MRVSSACYSGANMPKQPALKGPVKDLSNAGGRFLGRPDTFERRWVLVKSWSRYSQSVRLAATSAAQSSGGWPRTSMR